MVRNIHCIFSLQYFLHIHYEVSELSMLSFGNICMCEGE